MPFGASKIAAGAINANKLSTELRRNGYISIVADATPICSNVNGEAVPGGATGDTNRAIWRGGLYTTFHVKGAGQTILGPRHSAGNGVDLMQDQTDDEGAEHVIGSLAADSEFATVIGTDPNPFLRVKLNIVDVSGTDDLCIGFRKNEAFQAAVDNYDESFHVNINAGNLIVEGILNNAATDSDDTGQDWADLATHTIEGRLIGRRGVVLYDGTPLTGYTEFNFDTGEVVVPFIYALQAADLTNVYLQELACGRIKTEDLRDRG